MRHGNEMVNNTSFETKREKLNRFLKGTNEKQGFIYSFVRYFLLITIGFIFIYPLIYMISTSLMSLDDLLDISVNWIPSKLYIDNYINAAKAMDFGNTLLSSIIVAIIPTLIQVCSCAVIGYGFAKFEFKGKRVIMTILLFSFILPKQVTMMPTYVLFTNLKLIGSLNAFNLPALLGQGLNAQIFILIFYQFFKQLPQSLLEAAQIDGAGNLKSFIRIAIPSAAPAILVVFLFSFVWYWNESYLTSLYIAGLGTGRTSKWTSLVVELKRFDSIYEQYNQAGQEQLGNINESIRMAGTFLSILPPLIMYGFLQKYFIESVDRTGITGE